MAAKKSSALKKFEEKRAGARLPIDASAIVSRRAKPISRPAGVSVSEETARSEERDLMRLLISPSPNPEIKAPRTRAQESAPAHTQSPADTVVSDDTVALSNTVVPTTTVPPSDIGALNDTVPPLNTVAQSATVLAANTVAPRDRVALSDTVGPINTVSLDATAPLNNTVSPLATVPQSDTVLSAHTVVPNDTVLPNDATTTRAFSDRSEIPTRSPHTHPDIAALLIRYGNTQVRPLGRYTAVLWSVDDVLAQQQTPYEQAVYRQLYRLSRGFGNTHCFVGYDALLKRCNVGKTSLRMALKGLEGKRHIETVITINEKALKGTIYRVFHPEEAPTVTPRLSTSEEDKKSPAVSNTDELADTMSPRDTVSFKDTVPKPETVSDTNTVSSNALATNDTVSPNDTISTKSKSFKNKPLIPEVHPVVQSTVVAKRLCDEGETQVTGNLVLKRLPSPKPSPRASASKIPPGGLSEIESAYVYSRPSSEQREIFDAQDAWEEVFGQGTRPTASKLDEMLGYLRENGYQGGVLNQKLRECLEKTKDRAEDPVAWIISALKNGRYP